jgi:hypothetical protein
MSHQNLQSIYLLYLFSFIAAFNTTYHENFFGSQGKHYNFKNKVVICSFGKELYSCNSFYIYVLKLSILQFILLVPILD